MDEINQNQNTTEQLPPLPQQPAASAPQESAAPSIEYASILGRFIAILIDSVLVSIIVAPLTMMIASNENSLSWPLYIISYAYFVIANVKYGTTVGKKIMGFRVQDAVSGQNLDWVQSLLRETVGRMLSSILLLGYITAIKDGKKQTWHDKLAKSIVVKVK